MAHLSAVNKYFWKYRYRFSFGIVCTILSNYFAVLTPQLANYVIYKLQQSLGKTGTATHAAIVKDPLLKLVVHWTDAYSYGKIVFICALITILTAVISGIFMYIMRQTLIVMSRYIEYDQKNEVYNQYQRLSAAFYKTHSTGDLMNRMAEDIGRVRMYTGPALMYFVQLSTLIILCLVAMLQQSVSLTLIAISPLPLLTIIIYFVNITIHKRSERVQALLSDLTTNAQESYSGIRVIKSYVQEKAMLNFFKKNSEDYRRNAVDLAKVEAIYFPSMTLIIGLSTLITILVGANMILKDVSQAGLVVEFVMYIQKLIFPVSAIGWVASMTQRASASQKRLNEFLDTKPDIVDKPHTQPADLDGNVAFNDVTFTYPNTGITALKNFSLQVNKGDKVLILGKTGSGKTTLAQLLLRAFDPSEGNIEINQVKITDMPFRRLREHISYVPQDVFLFSDTIASNISFGLEEKASQERIEQAAKFASIHNEIESLEKGYQTMVGERGVTLSGGQKQRVSIARALIKEPQLMVFDDCLSAVDAKTENEIITNLNNYLNDKTAIIITHRIFTVFNFANIIILDNGEIIEQGTHEQLLAKGGYYAALYKKQVLDN